MPPNQPLPPRPDTAWNLRVAVLLGAGLLGWAVVTGIATGGGFSAECGNVAAALATGGGFAEPFGTPSGPTAWVSPVYPVLMAGLFRVFGIGTPASSTALAVLSAVGISVTAFLGFLTLDLESPRRWPKAVLAGLLASLVWIDVRTGYDYFHTPAPLIAACTAALLLALTRLVRRSGADRSAWVLLALTDGLTPLAHPGVGLACGVGTVCVGAWLVLRARRLRLRWLPPALGTAACLAVLAATVGGWTLRNYRVFGRFIPIKSNGPFETRLAQDATRDGVLSLAAILRAHPIADRTLRATYTRLGETAFLDQYRLAAGPTRPGDGLARYLACCGNRAYNAFCYTRDASDVCVAGPALGAADRRVLLSAGLVAPYWSDPAPVPTVVLWSCLDAPPAEIRARLAGLALRNRNAVWLDWLSGRLRIERKASTGRVVLSGLAMSGLPSLAFLASAALLRIRLGAVWWIAAGILVVSLAPNILITHDAQHQLHYTLLHAFLMTGFVIAVGQSFRRPAPPPAATLTQEGTQAGRTRTST